MAANEYLIAAAGHLESAAQALKMEADQIRAEFMTFDRDTAHEITTKDAERRSHIAVASTSEEDEHRAHLFVEAQRLKREIDDQKKELDKKRKEMNDKVNGKIKDMNDLIKKAGELRSKAASLK